MPSWSDHAIWWHVYPLGFVGAERQHVPGESLVHRLGQIEAWMDYAVELGVSGLALGPIFASSTHGYDTIDHFRIDPRLGDEADFNALVEAANIRGLRVLLDGVFNHVGRQHGAFREVLHTGPEAQRASWLKLSWPRGTESGTEPDYASFEGHEQLVALNHSEPAVAEHVASVMNYWLALGVDGWRLDAAYAVPKEFWAGVLPQVRSAHPDAYIVGEVIHGDYAAFVRETGMDAVTQYELWKAIWSSLNDGNLFELAHALERHNGFLDVFVPLTFLGNHDVTRIASQIADKGHLPHALAILFSCGGTPSIYAGDEQGFRGVKEDRRGGDDAVRPAFPPSPAGLVARNEQLFRLHQEMIGLRRRHPWLHCARTGVIHLTNRNAVFSIGEGKGSLLLALNLADDPAALPVPHARVVEAGTADPGPAGGTEAQVNLPAHGWALLAT